MGLDVWFRDDVARMLGVAHESMMQKGSDNGQVALIVELPPGYEDGNMLRLQERHCSTSS